MTALSPSPIQQFFDSNGVELAGGKLFTYAAGTTTKINVYTDAGGAAAFPNPIILNARGEPATSGGGASTGIWLTQGVGYKFVLSPATDTDPPTNPIWTEDNIQSSAAAGLQYVVDTGSVNALSVALTPVPSGYTDGMTFLVKVANTNSGAATINVNGLGAVSISFYGPVNAGALMAGWVYLFIYNAISTSFDVLTVPGSGNWLVNGMMASMAATSVKANPLGFPTTPQDMSFAALATALAALLTPPGIELPYVGSVAPAGWLIEDGSAKSRVVYPALNALAAAVSYAAPWGPGDGSTTFNIPDWRGYFPRGFDSGGSIDPGRVLGSTQQDAFQGHYMSPLSPATSFLGKPDPGSGNYTTGGGNAQVVATTGGPVSDGTHGTPRIASETRPINACRNFIIKT